MQHIESHDYKNILLNSSGLLDVRAPIEFDQGAFPNATNFPLLDDNERRQVGLCYKNNGQDQAVDLGHALVHGEIKQQRIKQWVEYAQQHNNAHLYCFRGGLRSKITQQWLHDAGINMPRVHGGYKALRQFLTDHIRHIDSNFEFILLGGLTGCKKTQLINKLKHGIDLEGAAYHRGSSFGTHATTQSTQINFENHLAIQFLRAAEQDFELVALEDESRFIGSVDIPKNIFNKMRASPLVVVEDDIESRLQQLLKEYVIEMEEEFINVSTNTDIAFESFSQYLLKSLEKISKRLGLQRWQVLEKNMRMSLLKHKQYGDIQQHLSWLQPLLTEYYDPMYTSQLHKRADSIIFHGNFNECHDYLNQYRSHH